jgi:hypothetical protein
VRLPDNPDGWQLANFYTPLNTKKLLQNKFPKKIIIFALE